MTPFGDSWLRSVEESIHQCVSEHRSWLSTPAIRGSLLRVAYRPRLILRQE